MSIFKPRKANWLTDLREAQQAKARTRRHPLAVQVKCLPTGFPSYSHVACQFFFLPILCHVMDILGFVKYEVETGSVFLFSEDSPVGSPD